MALLKDSITVSFVEDILDDLEEETIVNFMINALSRFIIPDNIDYIVITTDGYHYGSRSADTYNFPKRKENAYRR